MKMISNRAKIVRTVVLFAAIGSLGTHNQATAQESSAVDVRIAQILGEGGTLNRNDLNAVSKLANAVVVPLHPIKVPNSTMLPLQIQNRRLVT